jgi:hypothetical protein
MSAISTVPQAPEKNVSSDKNDDLEIDPAGLETASINSAVKSVAGNDILSFEPVDPVLTLKMNLLNTVS